MQLYKTSCIDASDFRVAYICSSWLTGILPYLQCLFLDSLNASYLGGFMVSYTCINSISRFVHDTLFSLAFNSIYD